MRKTSEVDLHCIAGNTKWNETTPLILLVSLFCLFALASTCIKQVYNLRLSCHKKRKIILSERAREKDNDNEIQNTKKYNELNIRIQFKTKQSRAEVTNRSYECVGSD